MKTLLPRLVTSTLSLLAVSSALPGLAYASGAFYFDLSSSPSDSVSAATISPDTPLGPVTYVVHPPEPVLSDRTVGMSIIGAGLVGVIPPDDGLVMDASSDRISGSFDIYGVIPPDDGITGASFTLETASFGTGRDDSLSWVAQAPPDDTHDFDVVMDYTASDGHIWHFDLTLTAADGFAFANVVGTDPPDDGLRGAVAFTLQPISSTSTTMTTLSTSTTGLFTATLTGALDPVPALTCSGFYAPLANGPVTVKKNRVLPLKADLFDVSGNAVDALDAPPLVQVQYTSTTGDSAVDVTDDALPDGLGTAGNQFEFATDHWQYNLATSNYSAAGTYVVTMASGDASAYTLEPTCSATFVVGSR